MANQNIFILCIWDKLFMQKRTICCMLCMGYSDNLGYALAWDNFDENSETLSGHDTLLDTVGICYQNIPPHGANADVHVDTDPSLPKETKYRRKRAFEPREHVIQPCMKKPRITEFS